MAYIIDTYNKYSAFDRAHSRFIFKIQKQEYAIKEVQIDWGLPILQPSIEDETNPTIYKIYDTYEDAYTFAAHLKQLNL